ncbi:hypothetical protein I656_03701 [Geobacillus sp. WSUCF1]|nr:hypothetical protein I656_03701 [Geobacillus sp. WSUCF1]
MTKSSEKGEENDVPIETPHRFAHCRAERRTDALSC